MRLPAADPVREGWEALANYRPDAALKAFDRATNSAEAAVARAALFGRSVTLLAKQPLQASQVEEARKNFERMAADGTDDVAQGSLFYLGRIAQHHREPPDEELARKYFRELIARYETSIWAQTALSRLALLEIYALNPQSASPEDRITAAENLIAHARVSAAESELRRVIAEAVFYYKLPAARALPHLLAADKLGGLKATEEADLWVQIAELSREGGQTAVARTYYEKVLRHYPIDPRGYMIRQKLAGIEADKER